MIVAEVAQAHDGSLGMAHAFIDAVANAGADAIKFQTHIAAAESAPHEQWRVKFSYQDATRYDYWRRMEFTPDQWHGLKRHCDARGLTFLSSPFSVDAVDLLTQVGVAAWKVASGEVASFHVENDLRGCGFGRDHPGPMVDNAVPIMVAYDRVLPGERVATVDPSHIAQK